MVGPESRLPAETEDVQVSVLPRICALCKQVARGHAQINDDWYCHGDTDPEPTCYQQAQYQMAFWKRGFRG